MLIEVLVGLISGFFGAIGIGGGAILMLYLCTFAGISITGARSMNMLFFIPCACVGVVFHVKNKLIEWKEIFKIFLFSLIGIFAGYSISPYISISLLKKAFGVFILILAIVQLKSVFKKENVN